MPQNTWTDTSIFKTLEAKKETLADKVIVFLKHDHVMDKIEKILDKGGSTPKDFTLHDSDHSFRVAERMWDLIPDLTKAKLSEYELAFLLLSAYLHDIGMSPDFETVLKHREFLTTNNKEILLEDEIDELQKWIDNDHKAKSIDIRKDSLDDLVLTDYILSYYIRHKHNDWSGKWIENNLKNISLHNYLTWNEDLIKVCKSHHYGLEHLLTESFDPKPIASKNVHLRYLALCLRVADVLENDPERTPDIILNHRMINIDSLKYWLKDRRFSLLRQENKFTIYARPEKAYLHKAIEETADLIEGELKLCDELLKYKPLEYSTFAKLEYYLWNIDCFVHRDIAPKEDTYVYIQGAFKPNTAKILDLLGGNQLYGNPIWAFRELIQNSFDAVKERIAYQIINEERNALIFLSKLGDFYSIDISLEKRPDGIWLICKDQGVGMTKGIIESYFLESGSAKRHEVKELERKCNLRGFNLNRTGQFGIGVLSYFMLADKIVVKTKRELSTGYDDSESIAWRFEINGTHDFGELIKYNKAIVGTEVELKLKEFIGADILKWNNILKRFMETNLIKSPCVVSYSSYLNESDYRIGYNWVNSVKDIRLKIIKQAEDSLVSKEKHENKMISSMMREGFIKNDLFAKECIREMSEITDFLFDEGEIEGLGKFRIHIPYFKLAFGNSFFYLKEQISEQEHLLLMINKGFYWKPQFSFLNLSLKGIRIEERNLRYAREYELFPLLKFAYIELDVELIDETWVSVSRHHLEVGDGLAKIHEVFQARCEALILSHKELFNNKYGILNGLYTDTYPALLFWAFNTIGSDEPEKLTWGKVELPLCEPSYDFELFENSKFENKKLNLISEFCSSSGYERYNFFQFIKGEYKLGILDRSLRKWDFERTIFPVLIDQSFAGYNERFSLDIIELPLKWSDILLVHNKRGYDDHYAYYLLNKGNKLFKYSNLGYNLKYKMGQELKLEDFPDSVSCFSFLLNSIINYQKDSWIGLCERASDIVKHVFNVLDITEVFILEKNSSLLSFSIGGFSESSFFDIPVQKIAPDSFNATFMITGKPLAS